MSRRVSAVATGVALGLVGWLAATRWPAVAAALGAVPPAAFAAAVALHLGVLVLRSEAWRLTLAAVAGPPLARRTVHPVNAGAFLLGSVQSQAALPTRVALLGRLPSAAALRPTQIGMADAPIFLLEVFCAGVLLAAGVAAGAGDWWAAPLVLAAGSGAVLAGRALLLRFDHRPIARGLAVLGDVRRRRVLLGLVACLTGLTALRIWLILAVCGLPHGLAAVATVFAALGVFGLLPLGPAASPGATLATAGTVGGVGPALAAGLVVSASSIAAVLVYAVVALACGRLAPARDPAPAAGAG